MDSARDLYINLMKLALTNRIYRDLDVGLFVGEPDFSYPVEDHCAHWPTIAHTMVGLERLNNIEYCLEQVLADGVPGDFIETGVWQGGACIFARALLKAHGVTDRTVWVADSFEGIPVVPPDGHPLDRILELHTKNDLLAVSEEKVRENFRRYDLLDDQVAFLPGWFSESLPQAPIDRLAVIRLDGDLYVSTMDALSHLYPKLSVGGFVIVDDYGIPACAKAVHEFREAHGVDDAIRFIDPHSIYWRRTADNSGV